MGGLIHWTTSDGINRNDKHAQEEPRLQVPRIFLDVTRQAMKDAVHLRPADLIFNLDEVGISEWEDRKSKRVVVPMTANGQTVHHAVSRDLKHLSIVTCISAGGQCLPPYMVTSQASQPVCRCLSATGLRIGTHLILQQRNQAYINSELFLDYLGRVFLPYLSDPCRRPELADEEAILLMDNCPAHVTREVLDLLTEARVRVVTFAPHTTSSFHVLDLTLFGVFKRHGQYHLPFETENRTADFIVKTYKDFRLTMIDTNIWGAFRAIGVLSFWMNISPIHLNCASNLLRSPNVVGFKAIQHFWFLLTGFNLQFLSQPSRNLSPH
jgi:hypothetical protein